MTQDIEKDIAFLKETQTHANKGFNGDWSSRSHVLDMIDHWIHELEELQNNPMDAQPTVSMSSQNKEDVLELALTTLEKMWLAFEIGALKSQYTGDGRDVLRSMWAVCDRLGVTKEDWQKLEAAALQDDFASGIPSKVCFRRFMVALTGINPEI